MALRKRGELPVSVSLKFIERDYTLLYSSGNLFGRIILDVFKKIFSGHAYILKDSYFSVLLELR